MTVAPSPRLDAELHALLQALALKLRTLGARMAAAESCTGGLIAAACTELAGSSDWFDRGIVSYSNAAKTELLGVPEALLAAHGAVSEPVARAMAEGMLARSEARISVAVTGIAGPSGGSADKPVGLVCFGFSWSGPDGQRRTEAERRCFGGDRAAVRDATLRHALAGVLRRLPGDTP